MFFLCSLTGEIWLTEAIFSTALTSHSITPLQGINRSVTEQSYYMERWRASSPEEAEKTELFSLPVVEVLVPVSLYGCHMYMMIHGSSFYNRLLAGECDSRWLSSHWATGWYESAHECLLVQPDIFLIKTWSRVCFRSPLCMLKTLSTGVRICCPCLPPGFHK